MSVRSAPVGKIWRRTENGLEIKVRLTPRSGHDRIDGVVARSDRGGVLAVRVRAVPEKGRANAALVSLLSKALGVPKTAVIITGGSASRQKTVHVGGDPVALELHLAEILAARGGSGR